MALSLMMAAGMAFAASVTVTLPWFNNSGSAGGSSMATWINMLNTTAADLTVAMNYYHENGTFATFDTVTLEAGVASAIFTAGNNRYNLVLGKSGKNGVGKCEMTWDATLASKDELVVWARVVNNTPGKNYAYAMPITRSDMPAGATDNTP